jgi:hypothetical protein
MTVEDKARRHWAAVRNRMDFDPVAILCDGIQRACLTVDLHCSDLGMRHPKRLGQMLDRLVFVEVDGDHLVSLISRQEIIQPA